MNRPANTSENTISTKSPSSPLSWQVDSSCQCGCASQQTQHTIRVSVLNQPSLVCGEATVVVGYSKRDSVPQGGTQLAPSVCPQLLQ